MAALHIAASLLLGASPAVTADDDANQVQAAEPTAAAHAAEATPAAAAPQAPAAEAGGNPSAKPAEDVEADAALARKKEAADAPPAAGEAATPKADPVANAAAAQSPAESGNRHNFEVYGFAQIDAIQDFDRVNPDWEAALRPSRIPTSEGQFGSDGQTILSVRQSRLGVRADGEIAGRDYEARVEFDLFGVGADAGQTTFRLRHAYGSWGPILAGQTNTLWMDIDLFPNIVEYWGPPGMVFLRNPQVRFTFLDNDNWRAAVALELPSDDIDPGAIRLIDPELATNLRSNEELPDLTAMVRYGGDWGHILIGGIARKIGFDTVGTPDNEPTGSEFGWGVNAAGVFKWSIATFRLGVVYGEGIATYMNDGGMDLAPSAALIPVPPIFPPPPLPPLNQILEAEAVPLLGITAYIDFQWTDELSSAIGYSFTEVDNTNFQEATAFHKGEYASVNLLWAPDPRILTGGELQWGRRTDNDGAQGDDLRIQFSFKLSFSSRDIWGG